MLRLVSRYSNVYAPSSFGEGGISASSAMSALLLRGGSSLVATATATASPLNNRKNFFSSSIETIDGESEVPTAFLDYLSPPSDRPDKPNVLIKGTSIGAITLGIASAVFIFRSLHIVHLQTCCCCCCVV